MMGSTLILEGEYYLGRFVASRGELPDIVGKEYAQHDTNFYCYEGAGIVANKDSSHMDTVFFGFCTDRFERNSDGWINGQYSLAELIVYWGQRERAVCDVREYGGGLEVVDGMYPKIVDLSLGTIFERAKGSTDRIPYFQGSDKEGFNFSHRLSLPFLNREVLEKCGLLIKKQGQVILPLGPSV